MDRKREKRGKEKECNNKGDRSERREKEKSSKKDNEDNRSRAKGRESMEDSGEKGDRTRNGGDKSGGKGKKKRDIGEKKSIKREKGENHGGLDVGGKKNEMEVGKDSKRGGGEKKRSEDRLWEDKNRWAMVKLGRGGGNVKKRIGKKEGGTQKRGKKE